MIRKLDELGRIVIPVEFRTKENWKQRDDIEIIENEHEIILKKHNYIPCSNCETKCDEDDLYCKKCGEKLWEEEEEEQFIENDEEGNAFALINESCELEDWEEER